MRPVVVLTLLLSVRLSHGVLAEHTEATLVELLGLLLTGTVLLALVTPLLPTPL